MLGLAALLAAALLLVLAIRSGGPSASHDGRLIAARAPLGGAAAADAATAGTAAPAPAPAPAAARIAPKLAPYRRGVVLVGFRRSASPAAVSAAERAVGARLLRRIGPAIRQVGHHPLPLTPMLLSVGRSGVDAAVARLRRLQAVSYAEPDYTMTASASTVPNDPSFPLQWGSQNTGQSIPTQGADEKLGSPAAGTPEADDDATRAWGITTGSSSIVIGETDTGIEYTHPDLNANVWTNPGGIGGCAAGTRGYNVVNHTCEPMDNDNVYGGHGTHVAGIMGAVGNNGSGVAGMNWHTTLLPVKWLNESASGSTSGLIEALQWLVAAKQAGVNLRVVNDSATFVGTAYSQALVEEIETLGANNILFVTAAGNTGNNNDELSVRRYPCGYDLANELCVAASNNNDQLPSWANYGPHTVQLAAPGVSIYSTLRGGKYGYLSGGSMASPQVAGAAALILSVEPALSATGVRADILEHVDKVPSLAGKVITGGRLNVCNALPGCEGRTAGTSTTFGNTAVGPLTDSGMLANYKIVHSAVLSEAGTVTKLSVYAVPGTASPSPQALKAVIYADSGGSPGALLATGKEVSYQGGVNGKGWFELPLSTPLALSPGTYWIGFIAGGTSNGMGYAYESVAGSRAYNANGFAEGPTNPFGTATKDSERASIYASYTPAEAPPVHIPTNTAPPTIAGTPASGQTLTASPGSWTESPTSYAYQWQRCEAGGAGCKPIEGATAAAYSPGGADVGSTLEVAVTASNSAGASAPATSTPTAVVAEGPATFGTTSVGGSTDSFGANRKRVNRYALPATGTVSKLTVYLQPTSTSGEQALEGIVYADSGGAPGALLGVTTALTFHSTGSAGWYELPFSTPLSLTAGNYWLGVITGNAANVIGFRFTSVAGSRDLNSNMYTSGPSNPFGSFSSDAEQMSLYATYTVAAPPKAVPANTTPPAISGTPSTGQTLSSSSGSWTESPTSYAYQWQRCTATGEGCEAIAGAHEASYAPVSADAGHALRVAVTASNSVGPSAPAVSAPTGEVTQAPATFGSMTVGPSADSFSANRKRVNRYALPVAGSVTKLSVYLQPGGKSGEQPIEGVVYSDLLGSPAALLGATAPITFHSSSGAGWYELPFSTPLSLIAGNYWLGVLTGNTGGVTGFRYTSVANSRDLDTNIFTSGPSNPFGSFSTDGEQMSLFATYSPS